jgi:hypothetical protein
VWLGDFAFVCTRSFLFGRDFRWAGSFSIDEPSPGTKPHEVNLLVGADDWRDFNNQSENYIGYVAVGLQKLSKISRNRR